MKVETRMQLFHRALLGRHALEFQNIATALHMSVIERLRAEHVTHDLMRLTCLLINIQGFTYHLLARVLLSLSGDKLRELHAL